MKIIAQQLIRKEVEIDLNVNPKIGNHFLQVKDSGGTLGIFNIKCEKQSDFILITYVYVQPYSKNIIQKSTYVEDLFKTVDSFNILNNDKGTFIHYLKGYDYEEIEMFNYILGLNYQNVFTITSEDFLQEVQKIIKMPISLELEIDPSENYVTSSDDILKQCVDIINTTDLDEIHFLAILYHTDLINNLPEIFEHQIDIEESLGRKLKIEKSEDDNFLLDIEDWSFIYQDVNQRNLDYQVLKHILDKNSYLFNY